MKLMPQPVLAERFKKQFHRETRTMQVMALTLPKKGHKMIASKSQKAYPEIRKRPPLASDGQ